jgi:hypothetical protein
LIGPQEDREVMPVIATHPGSSVKQAEGAVLFVQFEDGSTWGDAQVARDLLAARPRKFAFLEHLVETYYENGDAAFAALLNEPKHGSPEYIVAVCLKGDAEYEKIATIDLANKRLSAAQEWRALGIF